MRDRLELAQPSTQTPTAVLRLLADNGFEPEEIGTGQSFCATARSTISLKLIPN